MDAMRLPISLCLGALLSACTYASGDSRVLVTSKPPGAEILVDGSETGMTTPAMLNLEEYGDATHTIVLRKTGYGIESRRVQHYTTYSSVRWIDGADFSVWYFFTWWNLSDIFFPLHVKWQYIPHELYVKLYREGEGPIHAPEFVEGNGP